MSASATTSNTKASKDDPPPLLGPDQILESEEYITTKAEGAVKIRFGEDEYGKMAAESVPGTLMKAAEEVPDIVALSVKRENKWVNWTYKEYLEGNNDFNNFNSVRPKRLIPKLNYRNRYFGMVFTEPKPMIPNLSVY